MQCVHVCVWCDLNGFSYYYVMQMGYNNSILFVERNKFERKQKEQFHNRAALHGNNYLWL